MQQGGSGVSSLECKIYDLFTPPQSSIPEKVSDCANGHTNKNQPSLLR